MMLPVPDRDVIYKAVDSGAVLLSTKEEVYYGLNAVGGYIWEHLPPVLETLDELSASLSALYPEVPVETIRADASELLDDLLAASLVHLPAGGEEATRE